MMRPIHPGRILKRELEARDLSANRLSLELRVPSGRITQIVNGTRGISAETALRLSRYFGNSAQFWINLQSRYDLALAEKTLCFVQEVVEHTKSFSCIKYWQIENEPLSHVEVAAGRYLSRGFVEKEAELARALLSREKKVLLTTAISLLPIDLGRDDQAFEDSLALADAIGINVYTKVPAGPILCLEPLPVYWRKLAKWQCEIEEGGKVLLVITAIQERISATHVDGRIIDISRPNNPTN